jgi:hypothetical protein
MVASGGFHSLALLPDGSVRGWGDNSCGQLSVPPHATGIIAVDAGLFHSIARAANGSVFAWGTDYAGLTNVPATLTNAVMISAGGFHNLTLKSDGTVTAWGENIYGQCDVPCSAYQASGVAAGGLHSLALRADGTIIAWGDNQAGQLDIPPGLTGVVALAAGFYHSLALITNGTVTAWGSNAEGQTSVPAGLTGVVAIAAGYTHSLALKSDGTITTWGSDLGPNETAPPSLSNPALEINGGFGNGLALVNDAATGDVPELLAPSDALGINGLPLLTRVIARGQDLAYSAFNLPHGLTINPQNGCIHGAAETSGVFHGLIITTNSYGMDALACSFVILEAAPTVITNAPIPVPFAWLAEYCITSNLEQAIHQDPDHDDASTWQEYVMDTNPTNANSILIFDNINRNEGAFLLQWPGSSNRRYTLYYSTNLMLPFTNTLFTGYQPPLSGNLSWTDLIHGVEKSVNYRIEVELP